MTAKSCTGDQWSEEDEVRGTRRQFSENICSEDDLRSRLSEHLL